MNHPKTGNEVSQLRQVLLGLLNEVSSVLEKSSVDLDRQLRQIAHVNDKLKRTIASLNVLGRKSPADIETMKQMAKSLDKVLGALNAKNRELKRDSLNHLENDIKDIKKSIGPGQ